MIKELVIAKSPAAAHSLASEQGYCYISGGTEINRLNSDATATKVVSLRNMPFKGIEKISSECDGVKHDNLKIGSLCTFEECLKSADVPDDLKRALAFNSSLQKRNMATIGGNIAAARDDSYLIPTLAALNAKVLVRKKKNPIRIFDFLGNRGKEDLIEAIIVPLCKRRAASYRIANTAASHACVTVSLGCCGKPGDLKMPIAAAAVKGYGIMEIQAVEEEIESSGKIDPEKLQKAVMNCKIALKDDKVYGSAAFRKYEIGASIYLAAEELAKIFA